MSGWSTFNAIQWLASFTLLLLLAFCFQKRAQKTARALALFLLPIFGWSVLILFISHSPDLPTKIMLNRLKMAMIALLGPATYHFSQTVVEQGRMPRWVWGVCLVIPAITCFIALSPWHELLITQYGTTLWQGGTLLTFANGPWFHVHSIWTRLLIVASIIVLWFNIGSLHPFHRTRNWFIIAAIAIPATIDSIAVYTLPQLRFIQIVPTAFAFTNILITYVMFGRNLLEVVPIARSIIIEHLPDSFLMLDHQHNLVDYNPAAAKKFGLESKHLGQSALELERLPVLLRDPKNWQTPLEFTFAPNVTCQMETHPVHDKDGDPLGRVIAIRDITDAKRLETELKGINDVKTTFMGILAHDLAGNVSNIALNSEILLRDRGQLSSEDHDALVHAIHHSAKDVNDFIHQLTDWARSQFNSLETDFTATSMSDIVSRTSDYLRPLCVEKNVEIVIEGPAHTELICDTRMVETIVRNLIANAIKFSPTESAIKIRYWEEDALHHVCVHDQGRELPVERLNTFFADPSAGTHNLGLILCRTFIRLHNGKIWAARAADGTSQMTFTLPA